MPLTDKQKRFVVSRPHSRSPEAQAYRRLYKTAQWQRLREAKLAQDPLCEWCLEPDDVTEATEVHHAEGGHKGGLDDVRREQRQA